MDDDTVADSVIGLCVKANYHRELMLQFYHFDDRFFLIE